MLTYFDAFSSDAEAVLVAGSDTGHSIIDVEHQRVDIVGMLWFAV